MTYGKDEVKAGITILVALCIFGVSVILVGGARFWETYDIYYARFRSVAGLESGAVVRLGGLRVGKALDIRIPEDNPSVVEVVVGLKKGWPLYQGTKAMVATLGLVGDYYLLLGISEESKEILPTGSLIESVDSSEIGELMAQVGQLTESAASLVSDVNRIFNQKNIQNIDDTLTNVASLASETTKTIKEMRSDFLTLTQRLDSTLQRIDNLIIESKGDFQGSLEELKKCVASLEKSMTNIERFSRGLSELTVSKAEYLEAIIENIEESSENLRSLSQSLRERPWSIIYKPGIETREFEK
jgi:phospholipid/cholesterol/gamma-HCH transport system substrate-binding protein